ncbi:MAG: cytochrome c oxidase subunit I [Acidobacteria bacterium]|nr:cbb3-type cytochrome c oxidase subunit I [Acidobacteriota bacterium]MXW39115.1 cytochrome c oxidase subunit I [Acidobacteriota bacterium]MXZ59552.1 cytochrome c oxidase subunit I [Acidobacteriota bacterium]MYA47357.1 cytochrome c oxidase subunit I [Acidobacteriota bacterium]MYB31464.1 cytochrome c oxidase subunit I [Acidobacteriota bacterium]
MEHEKQGFVSRYIFSFDHKMIGKQYFTLAMSMGFIGGILAVLIRLQLGFPSQPWPFLENLFPVGMASGIMTPEFYVSLFTMHGTIMVFFLLSLLPVSGFGNFLIPLQIGARDMAFPFLNMLSFWTVVPGAIIIIISFFVEGGAAASGWTAYPPLSGIRSAIPGSGLGQTLWLVGMIFFVASFTMGGLNFVVTILNLRTKGLRMMRMPLTTWAQFVVGILGLLSFPALAAGALLLTFDRSLGTSFFLPAGIFIGDTLMPHEGGTPLLWQHLFWFLGHPEVYIIMLPAMGFTSDILATFCRRPIFGYRSMVYAIMAIGTLSFLVWGHHMFVSGMSPFLGSLFVVTTLAIAIPSAVKAFNWLFTIARARIQFTSASLFGLGVVSLFVTGGLTGIFLGTNAVDIQLHDTYFVVGHFHFIMAGAGLFGAFGAVYYWYPKMFGRMLSERLGKIHFWITFVAYYAVFFPMHYLGVSGMMRRIYDPNVYEFLQPLQPVNLFITISAFVLFAGQLVFIYNYFVSMRRGAPATANPWNAAGLEWSAPAHPGHGNWEGEIPPAHRWPYDYSEPGKKRDFTPQWEA